MNYQQNIQREIIRQKGEQRWQDLDQVAVEDPLEIKLNHPAWQEDYALSITMRTPGHDEDLVTGYLFTEGIINEPGQIVSFTSAGDRTIVVHLRPSVTFEPQVRRRQAISASGCGVCGKTSLNFLTPDNYYKPVASHKVTVNSIHGLLNELEIRQQQFKNSGSVHAAALYNDRAEIQLIREDIGRHNAVDKLIGAGLREKLPLPWDQNICLVSGRAGFELIQKMCMTGLSIFVAVGAPSSLAIEWAEQHQLTLIGFLRPDRFNIYTCPERIIQPD